MTSHGLMVTSSSVKLWLQSSYERNQLTWTLIHWTDWLEVRVILPDQAEHPFSETNLSVAHDLLERWSYPPGRHADGLVKEECSDMNADGDLDTSNIEVTAPQTMMSVKNSDMKSFMISLCEAGPQGDWSLRVDHLWSVGLEVILWASHWRCSSCHKHLHPLSWPWVWTRDVMVDLLIWWKLTISDWRIVNWKFLSPMNSDLLRMSSSFVVWIDEALRRRDAIVKWLQEVAHRVAMMFSWVCQCPLDEDRDNAIFLLEGCLWEVWMADANSSWYCWAWCIDVDFLVTGPDAWVLSSWISWGLPERCGLVRPELE